MPAFATTDLPKLNAGSGAKAEIIDQKNAHADELRQVLQTINLPEGFSIKLYALVPGVRHMAIGSEGKVVFAGSRTNRFWAIIDTEGDYVVDEVREFAPNVKFKLPNGGCVDKDGTLYIGEQNRVLAFPSAARDYANPAIEAFQLVPQDKLIPPSEESRVHSARVCRIGPDGKIYISLGQPYNVSPERKLALYDRTGIGGIIRMDLNGTNREVYAKGARNSVGLDFNPANGELWWTDNQVDGMGDTIPPGELNRQTAAGQHFGFPWYGGGNVRTREYTGSTPPEGVVFPAVEMDAHAADLGMTFYTGTQFPQKYAGGIFSAQHGSWDRTDPIGARVMFTAVNPNGSAGKTTIFADGWIAEDGSYLGRPVDILQMPDGSILVSDDSEGAIYRISYGVD